MISEEKPAEAVEVQQNAGNEDLENNEMRETNMEELIGVHYEGEIYFDSNEIGLIKDAINSGKPHLDIVRGEYRIKVNCTNYRFIISK